MSIQLEIGGIDIEQVLDEVESKGATSVHIIREESRKLLLAESESLYKRGFFFDTTNGRDAACIMQHWGGIRRGPFHELRDKFQDFLENELNSMKNYPMRRPINLDFMELIRYPKHSPGFPVHTDGGINLQCIFMIDGQGRFFVCLDEDGNNTLEMDTTPGNVIIMRSSGFRNTANPQFHCVTEIASTRYVFALRQSPMT